MPAIGGKLELMNAPVTALHAFEAFDPRIRRSRRMLYDALATLSKTKEFDRISIEDIAEALTVNRATTIIRTSTPC